MNAVGLPDTFFTEAPHWKWVIAAYFFLGGLAGGSYLLSALIDFFGPPEDRPLARLGYYVAFPAVVLSGILLTVDLTRPERFWHMLVQSNTGRPMLKLYSPMSLGAWALLAFGAFSLVAFAAALEEAGRLRRPWLASLRPPAVLGSVVTVVGGLWGFFLAGYTGVLLAVTNRPIWADSTLLGLNFIISAASTSAALLILLGYRRWASAGGLLALQRFDSIVLVIELAALVGLVASLGRVAAAWLNAWGAVLVVGVVIVGILVPLWLHWRSRLLRPGMSAPIAAVLVLAGGFIFRVVVVLSSEGLGVRV